MEAKHLYIIGGPNGAGKTTASYSVLPKILECREFVNADEIARSNVIRRRYQEGIDNLFHIYMPIVDTWVLVNNSMTPRSIVATGGRNQQTEINDEVEFKNIEAYVKH
jgi:predicted ABC-type ATPase